MSPPAATAAGRTKPRKPAAKGRTSAAKAPAKKATGQGSVRGRVSASRAKARPNAGHGARTPRRSPAPRIARRVSGPARGRAATAAAAVLPRPQLAPLGPRLVAFASTLPDRSFVDRMVRGRVWIGVLGLLLIGLVFTQVSLLKLNAGIGSAVERGASLERANGVLRAQVSQLESGERIQERAAALGMILPPAGQISYVRPQGRGEVDAAVNALNEGKFNDPTKAITLPGTDGPPDSLTTALTTGDETAAEDGSTDQESASTDGTDEESSTAGSTSGDTSGDEFSGGESSGPATGDQSTDSSQSGSGESTGVAAGATGGTGATSEEQ